MFAEQYRIANLLLLTIFRELTQFAEQYRIANHGTPQRSAASHSRTSFALNPCLIAILRFTPIRTQRAPASPLPRVAT